MKWQILHSTDFKKSCVKRASCCKLSKSLMIDRRNPLLWISQIATQIPNTSLRRTTTNLNSQSIKNLSVIPSMRSQRFISSYFIDGVVHVQEILSVRMVGDAT